MALQKLTFLLAKNRFRQELLDIIEKLQPHSHHCSGLQIHAGKKNYSRGQKSGGTFEKKLNQVATASKAAKTSKPKGRGKGTRNRQPPKAKIAEELERARQELSCLKENIKSPGIPTDSDGFLNFTHFEDNEPSLPVKKPNGTAMTLQSVKFKLSGCMEDKFIEQAYGLLITRRGLRSDWRGVRRSAGDCFLPMLRPDIFTGIRAAPKGILLYGRPSTGKTMIARCIAAEGQSNFFNVSASSLTSKWVGEGEKKVKGSLSCSQPSVIFIDEVDSLLSKRTEKENEAAKKIKTEFLVSMDNVLVVAATKRPGDIDKAIRRRFVKRFLVPLPDIESRFQIIKKRLEKESTDINHEEYYELAEASEMYSLADLHKVCHEAAMIPLRPINCNDVHAALNKVKPSVGPRDLLVYKEFDAMFGDKPRR
ncbi:Fidgetin-like protein 1 [Frankliniella fusca]|uniref:Fidgetin-like protein 1 n=1 Tax=Frankliniella fusca TaxID=407009 RepID=A0AAE1HF09_9NEOP|nr:Fidgetin-like protein 1 [Frankliniella fusca]